MTSVVTGTSISIVAMKAIARKVLTSFSFDAHIGSTSFVIITNDRRSLAYATDALVSFGAARMIITTRMVSNRGMYTSGMTRASVYSAIITVVTTHRLSNAITIDTLIAISTRISVIAMFAVVRSTIFHALSC